MSFPAPCSPHHMKPPSISTATTPRTGRDSSWSIRVRTGRVHPSPPLNPPSPIFAAFHVGRREPSKGQRLEGRPDRCDMSLWPCRGYQTPWTSASQGSRPKHRLRLQTQSSAASLEQVTIHSPSNIQRPPTPCPGASKGSLPPPGSSPMCQLCPAKLVL